MPLNNPLQGAVWPQNTWSNVNRTTRLGDPVRSLGSLPQLQDEHPGASSTLAKGNERGRINKCQLQDFK